MSLLPRTPFGSPSDRPAHQAPSPTHLPPTEPLAFLAPKEHPHLEPGDLPPTPNPRPPDTLTDKLLLAFCDGTRTLPQIALHHHLTISQLLAIATDPEFQSQLEALRRLSVQQTTLAACNYMPRGVQIIAQLIHSAELDVEEMRKHAHDLILTRPELFIRWSESIRKSIQLLTRLTRPPAPVRDHPPFNTGPGAPLVPSPRDSSHPRMAGQQSADASDSIARAVHDLAINPLGPNTQPPAPAPCPAPAPSQSHPTPASFVSFVPSRSISSTPIPNTRGDDLRHSAERDTCNPGLRTDGPNVAAHWPPARDGGSNARFPAAACRTAWP